MPKRQYLIKSSDDRSGRQIACWWDVLVLPLDDICGDPKLIANFGNEEDAELFVAAKEGHTQS